MIPQSRRRVSIAIAVVSILVGAVLGISADQVTAADVTLSVRIRPTVSATFTQEGVTILSNMPWQIEVATDTSGHGTIFINGGPTGSAGTVVPVSPGEEVLSVVALDR